MYPMTASLSVSQHQARLFLFLFFFSRDQHSAKDHLLAGGDQRRATEAVGGAEGHPSPTAGQTADDEEEVEALDMELPLRTLKELDEMETQLEDPAVGREW